MGRFKAGDRIKLDDGVGAEIVRVTPKPGCLALVEARSDDGKQHFLREDYQGVLHVESSKNGDEVIIIGEGDVVRLSSGGPDMAVERTWLSGGINYASTQWFDDNKLCEGSFPFDSLVKVASGN